MSIGKRVAEAVEKMANDDPEGALFQICSALDKTAKEEYLKGGREKLQDLYP